MGRYEILSPLGKGGMGEVYRARDPRLERDVAIKVLPESFAHDADARARLEREAKAVAALSHPNILAIHELGEADDIVFAVTECLEGETLRELLNRGSLSRERALELARQMANGLGAAHDKGIVHRDLKPENVFVTSAGVKILDFGLAKMVTADDPDEDAATEARTSPGTVMGTVGYMSPEQVRGQAADSRSDIFSFGAMLYEMLSGARAFEAESPVETMNAILKENPGELSHPAISRVVKRCLEKDAGERFQSVRELASALEADAPEASTDETPSVAVLPFENLSSDPDNEYFSDGITEDILGALAQVAGLRVPARSSCFAFKGQSAELVEVGKKLNVTKVLEGSVRKAGNRLRISAQLVNIDNGYQEWSERYDRDLTDVFAIQDEIARTLAEKLEVTLVSPEAPLVKPMTKNQDAYQLYLKGRFHWHQRPQGLRQALSCFRQATELDSDFALAQAGLADGYSVLATYGNVPPLEVESDAKAAAERAVQLAPDLSEAHSAWGLSRFVFEWGKGADAAFQRAIELDENAPIPRYWYGVYLFLVVEDKTAGLHQLRRGLELDPMEVHLIGLLGMFLAFSGRPSEALELVGERIEPGAETFFAHRANAYAYDALGRHDDAIASAACAVASSGRHPWSLVDIVLFSVGAERTERARELYAELQDRSAKRYVSPMVLGLFAAELDKWDEAAAHCEQAYRSKDIVLIWTAWPGVRRLLENPRCKEWIERANNEHDSK